MKSPIWWRIGIGGRFKSQLWRNEGVKTEHMETTLINPQPEQTQPTIHPYPYQSLPHTHPYCLPHPPTRYPWISISTFAYTLSMWLVKRTSCISFYAPMSRCPILSFRFSFDPFAHLFSRFFRNIWCIIRNKKTESTTDIRATLTTHFIYNSR